MKYNQYIKIVLENLVNNKGDIKQKLSELIYHEALLKLDDLIYEWNTGGEVALKTNEGYPELVFKYNDFTLRKKISPYGGITVEVNYGEQVLYRYTYNFGYKKNGVWFWSKDVLSRITDDESYKDLFIHIIDELDSANIDEQLSLYFKKILFILKIFESQSLGLNNPTLKLYDNMEHFELLTGSSQFDIDINIDTGNIKKLGELYHQVKKTSEELSNNGLTIKEW